MQTIPASVVVMTRPAVPGRVKTRLIGTLTPHQAAAVHGAMLACVLARVGEFFVGCPLVVALDQANPTAAERFPVPPPWRVVDQGDGDLGQRMTFAWTQIDTEASIFLGTDSPDVPRSALSSLLPSLNNAEAAVGPTPDGGYWTLACRHRQPQLLAGIDWGSGRVYHQTRDAARQVGIDLFELAEWFDVDTSEDLWGLRQRLRHAREPALAQLRRCLNRVCKESLS